MEKWVAGIAALIFAAGCNKPITVAPAAAGKGQQEGPAQTGGASSNATVPNSSAVKATQELLAAHAASIESPAEGSVIKSPSADTLEFSIPKSALASPTAQQDPDDVIPDPKWLARVRVPKVEIYAADGPTIGYIPATRMETFAYTIDLKNDSIRQIAEVDLALALYDRTTNKEVFRSKPVPVREFDNERIPHVGALEGFSTLDAALSGKFAVPVDRWTTGVYMRVIVSGATPVADEGNLHDIGNLISFMSLHRTAEIEQAFVKDPALIKVRNSLGTTPCLLSMACGTPRLKRFLMAHGGDIHAKTVRGQDAFHFACGSDEPKRLEFLLGQGFSVNVPLSGSKRTPLIRTVLLHRNKAVRWLIDHGADVNAIDATSWTPLLWSVNSGNIEAYEMLVAAKADINYHNASGMGLMHIAVRWPAFFPKLIAAGLKVDDSSRKSGATPLMLAAVNHADDGAKWLLAHGADVNAKDYLGRTVFDYAKMTNTLHTDEFFRKAMGLPAGR